MVEKTIKRQIAHKVTIEDLKRYPYVKQEGWLPNFLDFPNKKVSRVNILGTIILKPINENNEQKMLVIDDGTDQIEVRTFENDFDFTKFVVGDLINIIGKVREFNNNKYVIPEILNKISNLKMIELRKKEIKLENMKLKKNKPKDVFLGKKINKPKQVEEKKNEEVKTPLIYDKIINEIRKLDRGNGANIQEILVNTNLINKEILITELLEKGDVFEISPGKIKILE